jgi:hypothetical protein
MKSNLITRIPLEREIFLRQHSVESNEYLAILYALSPIDPSSVLLSITERQHIFCLPLFAYSIRLYWWVFILDNLGLEWQRVSEQ